VKWITDCTKNRGSSCIVRITSALHELFFTCGNLPDTWSETKGNTQHLMCCYENVNLPLLLSVHHRGYGQVNMHV